MRIVLIGKNGQVGWELQRSLPILGDVIALSRNDLDLARPVALEKTIVGLQPHLIINAAAYTDVDLAETQAELAMTVNAVSPGILAELSRKMGAVFIHYSTDYVFDGQSDTPYSEDDPPNPLNKYGKSKYLGEENIKQAGPAYLIFRTSWVYSMRGKNFVTKVLEWSRQNKTLKIVSDQISNPTWARMLAEVTSSVLADHRTGLLEKIGEKRGIYHLAGGGYTSRFAWAKHILANDPSRTEQLVQAIEPVSSDEFHTPAKRPLFTALDCSRLENTFEIVLPDWKISFQEAMQE